MFKLKRFFQKVFPCHFNEPLCKDNFFGCRCGKKRRIAQAIAEASSPTQTTQQRPDKWTQYWTKLSGTIPQEQVASWMNQWSNDPNFPWGEVVQDYANVFSAGNEPAFAITPEGGLQMKYNPYQPPTGKLGIMTPELATPFKWNEGQITQFNQNVEMRSMPQALYPFAARIVKEREAARGVGEAPMTTRNIPIGGQLLGREASVISPTSLITDIGAGGGVNPLTLTELIQGT